MDSLSFKDLKLLGQSFVSHLIKAEYREATNEFDEPMKNIFNENKLKETWEDLIKDAGTLFQFTPTRTAEQQQYKIVLIRCEYQLITIDIQVVFNKIGQISGLSFNPLKMTYNPPEYVDETLFHEVEVTVGRGKWELPGTLTIPNGSGPFPGVVLVHGSGPNDRDETLGPNKTFRDIAWGLASKNIAVLRYDKRTFKHSSLFTPDLVKKMTVKEEVIDDAVSAIQFMNNNINVDSKQIFMLGHSWGATLAPLIGKKEPVLAGLIIMAGLTRSLEDTLLDQYKYIYSLSDDISDEQKAELESLKAKVDHLKNVNDINTISPEDLPLGIPLNYWRDLHDYKPLDVVKTLDMSLLILQGGRDYQVLENEDYKNWKKALQNNTNADFRLFNNMNHLFIAGDGKSSPNEYMVEGHVSGKVIETIVKWIKKISA
jgi:uncharacterized protein